MKRKRGGGRRKPILAAVEGAKETVPNIIGRNTQDELGLDDIDNAEFETRMEIDTPQNGSNRRRQQAGLQAQKVVDVTMEDSTSSFHETEAAVSAILSKITRSIRTRSAKGLTSSSIEPGGNPEQVQDRRAQQKEPNMPRQDPQHIEHKEQELKAALAVIKKVMKMDAAEPFNVPVDPITLGIPDYFDIIRTPMDFGTIRSNLENGVKYKNSKNVLRDVQYIWDNCCKYNKKGHYILELMKRVKKNFTKFWTEAGLHMENQQEIDDTTTRCSIYDHRTPLGSMAHYARHQQQDQAEPSRLQPQPSLSCCQSYQPQKRPCLCQPGCGQQQTSQPWAGINVGGAGDFYSSRPEESMIRCTKHGPRCPVDPTTDYISDYQQDQIAPSRTQPHQPPSSYGQEDHPPQRTCRGKLSSSQLHPGSHQSRARGEMDSAGHFYSQPPVESMRLTKSRPGCPTGPMTSYIGHQQQDQITQRQTQPHQPSSSLRQPHQPHQGTCQGQMRSSQPQPSQPQAGLNMGSAGNVCSPPAAEAMIRCAKSGPRRSAGPMSDYISHQQQDQTISSQTQPHQPSSSSDDQTYQPPQGTSRGQQHSRQPQPSQPQAGVEMRSANSNSTRRKTRGRGPTRCLDVWNSEGKLPIETNEFGQPIGLDAPKLINFLGTVARDGHISPLNYVDWRAVPDENKEKMWQIVQSKFEIDPTSKSWVLKSIANKWRNWKANLKAFHYIPHKADEERLADRDERVLPDQWRILISFWNSEEAKERSVTNKACRSHQKISHATGSKSFARIREEQRAKRPDGKEPSRAELFIATRTRKDGRPVDEASSAIISQIHERAAQNQGTSQKGIVEDEVFFQVMGQDRHGRVRTYGLGPSPSDVGGTKRTRTEALKMVSEANAEVREMKEKMVTMEQTCAQMAAQMATMMSMMSTMQRKFPDRNPPDVVDSPSKTFHAEQGVDVSGNSEESQQLQRSEMRGKKNTRTGKVTRRRR
ncbi:Bromodomain-containing protein [Actinidia chinensis var. chinensis]|uniref:Bromodomain-containing protein n=1 Tax=Actinidia chinensis var. chinensis TaxID=1590841 RepID=A0A2R6Q6L1_ACTCC|nr:Bromodomain-containing protein [Actinidia chinensis var. chinensis]